jgi:hypothetical protein
VPTTNKIRYFQLKIVQSIIIDKPELISKHSKLFQYEILLKDIYLTQKDEAAARDDVVEYLHSNENDLTPNFSNTKKVATEVWGSFMQVGSRLDSQAYHPGPLFQENFEFMLSKVGSSNLLEKELGMYLFCETRITIGRVPAARARMPEILQKYVVEELANPAILMRARANDMFTQYGKEIQDVDLIRKSIEGLFKCLT